MSDLISRSKLKKTLLEYNYTTENNQIFRYIDEQPAAYDIDKVVDELQGQKHMIALDGDDADLYKEAINDAIEIVKQGGVSDDVCEWKLEDEESNLYATGCEQRHLVFYETPKENGYKFCPYCGKKIKEMQDK